MLYDDESIASNTVTAVKVPEGVDVNQLLTIMREDHGVVIAGSYGALSGKMFRIGHVGYVTPDEIQDVLDALEIALPKVGFSLQ